MKAKATKGVLAAALLLAAGPGAASPARAEAESEAQRQARMAWWTNDRFGMFIHFGLYSLAARHEWVKSLERRTDADYDRYLGRFDPDRLDAHEWARQARAAGMRYMVLTTKHHEGFCLFDSKLTDYKITNTPFGRDLVREFVEACRAEGLKVGFYYSLPDWHHPDFPVDRYHPLRPVDCGPWDPKGMEGPDAPWDELNRNRSMERYRRYLYGQVTELLTNYGKIDLLWFDFTMTGKRTKHPEDWQSDKLMALVRKLQPGIIVNDRLGENGQGLYGDFVTPEQQKQSKWVERRGRRVAWEMCQTFSGSWGYHRDEQSWKTPCELVDILVSCVSHGGNLILNVGPTGRGNFDSRAQDRLRAIGEWMAENGRAVRGCTEAPAGFEPPEGAALTYNPSTRRLYVHLLKWPEGGRLKVGFADKVAYAQLLADASEVRLADGALLLPARAPGRIVPVVEVFL